MVKEKKNDNTKSQSSSINIKIKKNKKIIPLVIKKNAPATYISKCESRCKDAGGKRVVVEFGYLKKPSVTLTVIISVYLYILRNC